MHGYSFVIVLLADIREVFYYCFHPLLKGIGPLAASLCVGRKYVETSVMLWLTPVLRGYIWR
jgi:hypothetical protein